MTRATQLAQVHRLVEFMNSRSADAVVSLLAANISWRRGDGRSLEGWQAVGSALKAFFTAFPDATFTSTRVLPLVPNMVLVEWVLDATHIGLWPISPGGPPVAPQGQRVRIVGADLMGFNPAGEIAWDDARIDTAALLAQLAQGPEEAPDPAAVKDFAERYTAAWCSQNPLQVASFYMPKGILRVNGGVPAVGHDAIVASAAGFMIAFPDMQVRMDGLLISDNQALYRWTLTGTNTGPGGTGNAVNISGYEVWRLTQKPLIAESLGHFDSAGYQRQIETGHRHETQRRVKDGVSSGVR